MALRTLLSVLVTSLVVAAGLVSGEVRLGELFLPILDSTAEILAGDVRAFTVDLGGLRRDTDVVQSIAVAQWHVTESDLRLLRDDVKYRTAILRGRFPFPGPQVPGSAERQR